MVTLRLMLVVIYLKLLSKLHFSFSCLVFHIFLHLVKIFLLDYGKALVITKVTASNVHANFCGFAFFFFSCFSYTKIRRYISSSIRKNWVLWSFIWDIFKIILWNLIDGSKWSTSDFLNFWCCIYFLVMIKLYNL